MEHLQITVRLPQVLVGLFVCPAICTVVLVQRFVVVEQKFVKANSSVELMMNYKVTVDKHTYYSRHWRQIYLVATIIFICNGCSSEDMAEPHFAVDTEIDTLINVTTFGDPSVVLGGPYQIVVSDNSVFVSDNAFNHIKRYDINGTFLGTIGSRGRGPGEFLTINHFGITDGKLLAFDEYQYRSTLISIDSNKVLATYPNNADMLWIRDFQFRDDTLSMLYATDVSQSPLLSMNVIHTFVLQDGAFHKVSENVDILNLYPMEYTQDIAQLIAGFNTGYVSWGDTISYFVPHIFGGKIYGFNRNWILADSIDVSLMIGQAVRSLEHGAGNAPDHANIVSGARRATGIVDSEVIGLAKTNRNELIIANLINHQDKIKYLYLHIVTSDEVKTVRITDFDPIHVKMNFSYISLQDIDSNNNLYFIYSWQDESKILKKNIRHLLGG